jgi:hypothetical protein
VIILVVLTLGVVMAMLAFAIDVPNMYRVQTELRASVDSAALAGASGLDGTVSGITLASTRAVAFADKHYAYDADVALDSADVQAGVWDFQTDTFTAYSNAIDASNVNAVKVTHRIAAVSLPFGAVMGTASNQVEVDAIAVGGGPYQADCGFPLVVPDCALDTADTHGTCDFCMIMQSANTDNGAWTSFAGSIGGPQIFDAVSDACTDGKGNILVDAATGECQGTCSNSPTVDEGIKVQGGNLLNKGANSFCELIQDILNRDGAPKPFTVTAPVVATGLSAGDCTSANLNNTLDVAGYATLDVFGARCGNGDDPVVATLPNVSVDPNCDVPSGKFVLISLHRDENGKCESKPSDVAGGGGFYGTDARPRLVQ